MGRDCQMNGDSRPAVAIHTHGCKLNQADSAQLARRFTEAGYRLVDSAEEADVFVLNTCTVTAEADAKARQALRAARRLNPDLFVVATGCYPQRAAGDLENMDAVSLVVPNTEKERLVPMVTGGFESKSGAIPVGPLVPERDGAAQQTRKRERLRAMVKIQEGCDQVCAYCIVPKVRGRERSIPPDVLVRRVNREVREGAQEVVLTGTQLGTYGFDLPGIDLPGLLRRLLAETEVARLRVSSLQAQEIGTGLLDLWQNSRLCPHFHVPLQSGSDETLKAMRRQYTTTEFAKTLELIRRTIPVAGITTDIIVGFPGEGEREFEKSLSFAEDMEFGNAHVFPYSIRPGTSAAHFSGQVDERQKRERVVRMIAMATRHFQEFRRKSLGQVRPILWESERMRDGGRLWSGLTDNYIRVSTVYPADLKNAITSARLNLLAGQTVTAQVC